MRLSAALSEIGQLRLQLETNQQQQAKQRKEASRSASPVQQREGENNTNDAQTSTSTTSSSTERKLRMFAYEAGKLRSEVANAEATSATLRNDVTKASAISTAMARRAHRFTRKIERIAKDSNEHSSALSEVLVAIGVSNMSGVSRFLAECKAVGRRLFSAAEAYRVDKGERRSGDGENVDDLGEEEEEEEEDNDQHYDNSDNIENASCLQPRSSSSTRTSKDKHAPSSPTPTPHSRRHVVSFAVPSPKTTARARSSESRISSTSRTTYSSSQQQRPIVPSYVQHQQKDRDLFANSARSAIAELAAENASLNDQLASQMERQAKLEAMLADARAAHSLKIDIDSALQSMRGSLITAQRAAEENKAFAERMQREKEASQGSYAELRSELHEARDMIRNLQLDLVERDRQAAELEAAATAAARAAANAASRTARNINSHQQSRENLLDVDAPSYNRSSTASITTQRNTISSRDQTTSPKRAGDEQIEPKRLSVSLSTSSPTVKRTSSSMSGFGSASMKQPLVSPPQQQTSQPHHPYYTQTTSSRQTASLKAPTQTATHYPQQQRGVLKRTLSSSSSSSLRASTAVAATAAVRAQQPARSSPVAGGRGGLQGYAPALTSPVLTSSVAYEKSSTSRSDERHDRDNVTAPDSQDSSPTNSTSSTLSRDIGELIGRGAHLRATPNRGGGGGGERGESEEQGSFANHASATSQPQKTAAAAVSSSINSVPSSANNSTTIASVLNQEVSEAVISLAEQLHAMSVSTPPPPYLAQRSAARTKEKLGRGGVSSATSPPPPVSPPPLAAIPRASDSQAGGIDMHALAEIRAGLTAVDEEIASMRAKVSAATSAAAAAAAKARNSNTNNAANNKTQTQRTRRDSSGLNISIGSSSSTATSSLEVPELAKRDKVWVKLEEGLVASPPDSLKKKSAVR